MAEGRRLYVGNLFPEVTDEDLRARFARAGEVRKVEIKTKRDIDGQVSETFAFLDLATDDAGLASLLSTMANTKVPPRFSLLHSSSLLTPPFLLAPRLLLTPHPPPFFFPSLSSFAQSPHHTTSQTFPLLPSRLLPHLMADYVGKRPHTTKI